MLAEVPDVILALKRDEIVPFFQPVVELRTGHVRGFEVLARWRHPILGPILPRNFIALAEDNGLIGELTEQICRKAFLVLEHLSGQLTLAVNASPIQMRDFKLPTQIRRIAEETGFPLRRLIVEITESSLHHDLERAQQVAAELKAMGCKLGLDDFGTGYSSLRHLQSLQFDEIKIDQSFIDGMIKERSSRKIVAAIIGLGQSLGLDTIAEGVETEEQADMLIWLGCEQAQGWRYGKAEAVDEVAKTIAAKPIAALSALASPGDGWATSSLEALPTLRLAQLQAIYDGAPVGLCFLDNKLRYVSINQRLADMNGLSIRAHLGRSVRELYPEWFLIYEPFYLRALQGEAISGVEFVRSRIKPEDTDRKILASYQPAWDEADEVIGISISVLDITDLGRSERVAAPHTPLEVAAENYPGVSSALDDEGNDLQISSRWVQVAPLGMSLTRNLHWLEALHIDDLEPTIKIMKHAVRTGTPLDVEYRVLGFDGDWRWMRSRGSPRLASNGETYRWYGSVEDISDRKISKQ